MPSATTQSNTAKQRIPERGFTTREEPRWEPERRQEGSSNDRAGRILTVQVRNRRCRERDRHGNEGCE
ncbi:hypothetical protein EUGRSUZ_B00332 [Eucalyptus grandis]|uniref:Uncharacterized protein n=2 Tax=Eucalyptus grandis TaxID=71139 RepID=A0ACC3LMI0_EUCGR|nr:hypothetical protein EUGRSUZ_B00332 [Eucalyptus grandis]